LQKPLIHTLRPRQEAQAPLGRTWRKGAALLLGAALSTGALLVYGDGWLGYDASYALLWGSEAVDGRIPDFRAPTAPTPHPLANAVGALADPLGGAADDVLAGLVVISLVLLAMAGFALGEALFSSAIGVLFAAILITRPTFVGEALQALVDIPFLALVLGAAAIGVRHPDRAAPVLGLLTLAGLLRPEAWPLALGYAAYAAWRADGRRRVALAAAGLAAPLTWAVTDLIVTGDPLWSLHGTRDLAERLERPRGLDDALPAVPQYMEETLGGAVIWVGLAGALVALWIHYERSRLPVALTGLGLLGFLVLSVAGLPLLIRYLAVPSAMVALFAAVAILGWTLPETTPAARRVWIPLSAALALVLVASAPGTADELGDVVDFADRRDAIAGDLDRLVRSDRARLVLRDCRPIGVQDTRALPVVARALEVPTDELLIQGLEPRGAVVIPRTDEVARDFSFHPTPPAPATPPRRSRLAAASESWAVYSRCGRFAPR
jgi:hypothetical protein